MRRVPIETLTIERARHVLAHPGDYLDQRHTLFPACWRFLRAPRPLPVVDQPGDAA